MTLSNESAEIKITTEETTGTITSTASAGGSVGSITTTPERFETGISLKVTPQIDSQSGTVTMFIQPIVSQTKASPITNPDNGVPFRDPEVRTSATTLRVKDGETIVVGGLIKTNDQTAINKMPFFGDLPIIGGAFRHKEKIKEERELIVFITPHIVGQDNVIALAKGEPIGLARTPMREQSSAVGRKEQVDNMLERWEN